MALKSLAALFLALMQAFPAWSQQDPASQSNPQDKDTIKIGTAAVQMDVIVTDKTGRRINGLKSEDFQVMDEGVPQTLDFFLPIDERTTRERAPAMIPNDDDSMPGVTVTPLATPFRGRYIAIVIDDLHLSGENLLRSRMALAEYVNTRVSTSDIVAVTSTAGGVAGMQQFTSDKQRLLAAINRSGPSVNIFERSRDPRVNLSPGEAIRIDSNDSMVLDAVVRRISNDDLAFQLMPAEALESMIRETARTVVRQIGFGVRSTMKTLENLCRSMSELPGRKVVVVVTEMLVTASGTSEDVSGQLLRLVDLARRSGVSVYTVDAGGLRTQSPMASERITGLGLAARMSTSGVTFTDFENMGAARALTLGTGGEIISNTNNLSLGLQKAVEDSSAYYVLGFTPTSPPDNRFHRLAVTVKGRSDLIVRTKYGYFYVDEESSKGKGAELLAALLSPVPRIDLPLEVVANVVPREGRQIIQAGVHIGRNYLKLPTQTEAEQKASYEVVMLVFAAGKDNPVGAVEHTFNYDLKADPGARDKLKSQGFVMVKEFYDLAPGSYQIRAVMREKTTGLVGSAYQFFEVPDLRDRKSTALSSLVLLAPGQKGFDGHNSFKPGVEADLHYVIYNPPQYIQAVVQRVRIINEQGRILINANLPTAPPKAGEDSRQATQGTRLKLPAERGRYMLIVNLSGERGKIKLERSTDFVIE